MNPPYVLSFKPNVGRVSHDQAAALFGDGELLAAAAEERFTREKHAIGQFPVNAIEYCLSEAGIELRDVSTIVVADNPRAYLRRLPWSLRNALFNTDGPLEAVGSLRNAVFQGIVLRALFPNRRLHAGLSDFEYDSLPRVEFVSHHRSHAASTYYFSGFDDATVVTVDGSGEYDSSVLWTVENGRLSRSRTFETPNSIGKFYGLVTKFLGYRMNNGETKIMGMAPYGEPNEDVRAGLLSGVDYGGGEYNVTAITDTPDPMATLDELLPVSRRRRDEAFTDSQRDLAYEVQRLTEELVLDLVKHHVQTTGSKYIAVAGGVFLNCKLNKRIMESPACEELFIQPASGDDGLAIGAGAHHCVAEGHRPAVFEDEFFSPYLGSRPTDEEIAGILRESKLDFYRLDEESVADAVADDVAAGKLVAHVDGRMEFGPRALGNRSILADPRTIESKDRVNEHVKHREGWRPFAPSMLAEAADRYLINAEPSPYMIKTFDVRPERTGELQAVIHEGDDTTRPQTVTETTNPRYYEIISAFEERTGVPVVLNTSYNDNGEPIVRTAREAVRDFYSMGLDVLYVGRYRVAKPLSGTVDAVESTGPDPHTTGRC